MAHISLPEGVPGIRGLMAAYPEAQKPLCDIAEALLRGPSSLTPGEVDGLGISSSHDTADYVEGGNRLAHQGYHALDHARIRGAWQRPS